MFASDTASRPQTDEIYGFEGTSAFYHDPHVVISEYLLIFASLIVASVVLQHLIEKSNRIKRYLPEAAATMLLGMLVGLCIRLGGGYDIKIVDWTSISYDDAGSNSNNNNNAAHGEASVVFDPYLLGFNPQVFFFGFLPPIIFNSGFHLKRRLFYQNFGGIFCLAVVGTCISIFVVSCGVYLLSRGLSPLVASASPLSMIECVCFASLISSTDPVATLAVFQSLRVDPMVFYLVFGESVLNDAIAITVFRVTSKFVGYDMRLADVLTCSINFVIVFVASCGVGYIFGIVSALLFRLVDFRHHKLATVAVFVSVVYIPFFLSETLQLSGIVTILFAGKFMTPHPTLLLLD